MASWVIALKDSSRLYRKMFCKEHWSACQLILASLIHGLTHAPITINSTTGRHPEGKTPEYFLGGPWERAGSAVGRGAAPAHRSLATSQKAGSPVVAFFKTSSSFYLVEIIISHFIVTNVVTS